MHGLLFGGDRVPVQTYIRDNGTYITGFSTDSGYGDIMFSFAERTFTNLQIEFVGGGEFGFDDVIISYAAAGTSTAVPHGGLNPGQVLPYLQYNYKTKGSLNTNGQPIRQRRRKVPTTVSVSLPKVTAEWVRSDLKQVFDLFAQTGVVSMLDFESEDYPTESWAAFNLGQTKATAFDGTRTLIPVTLTVPILIF